MSDEPVEVAQGHAPWRVVGTVGIDGPLETTAPPIESASPPFPVAASTSSVTLLSSNPDRVMATIYNDSTANLYVKFGDTASSTDFTILIYPGQGYEVPGRYTGRVDGVWASANGAARVTDLRWPRFTPR